MFINVLSLVKNQFYRKKRNTIRYRYKINSISNIGVKKMTVNKIKRFAATNIKHVMSIDTISSMYYLNFLISQKIVYSTV